MSDYPANPFGAENPSEELDFNELAAQLGLSLPLEAPRPEVKQKLMAAIRATPQCPQPGVFIIPASGGEWKATAYPGVSYKPLYFDADTSMQTLILRLAPGAKYPSHRHKRAEQCLVLSGQVSIGPGINIGPGDFEWAEASTDHDAVYSEHGCDLLIIASRHDEVLASPNLRGGE